MAEKTSRVGLAGKRLFDILVAGVGLCLLAPVLLLLAALVAVGSGFPVFYREYRVGRYNRPFPLYKFRTLRAGSGTRRSIAPEDDPRIVGAGLWLRRWRLDELPQLYSVLCGDMSLVGPRPMPPSHAASLPAWQRERILSVRPGVTDPAALYFLGEDAVLSGRDNQEALYLQYLLPAKAAMQIDSLREWSFPEDMRVLLRTLALLWSPGERKRSAAAMRQLLPDADGHGS